MATISFYSNTNYLSTSGLGFYGSSGFGYSVAVGSYQDTTYITDSTGTAQGAQAWNNKYSATSGVSINGSGMIHLRQLPNYQASLNPRFTHSSSVQTQNAKIYGYDRSNKNNNPSGVTIQAYNVIHPPTSQTMTGSGTSAWTSIYGSGSTLSLVASPGVSGLSPNGTGTSAAQHDWYVALSLSPNSVGAKTPGLYFELEFL
jgi:hypothetical protein